MKKTLLFALALIAVGCGPSDRQGALADRGIAFASLSMFEEEGVDEWIARFEEAQDSIASRCEGARPAAAQTDLEEGECTEDGYSRSLSEMRGSGEDMVSETKAISWLWEDLSEQGSEQGSMHILSEGPGNILDLREITRSGILESGDGLSPDTVVFQLHQSGNYTEGRPISLLESEVRYYPNSSLMLEISRSWSADKSYEGSWEMHHENGKWWTRAIITDGVFEGFETYCDNGQLESKHTLLTDSVWQITGASCPDPETMERQGVPDQVESDQYMDSVIRQYRSRRDSSISPPPPGLEDGN